MRKIDSKDLPKFILFIICALLCLMGAVYFFMHWLK